MFKTTVIPHRKAVNPKLERVQQALFQPLATEGLVLQGMRNTILAAQPVVFIECSEIGRQICWDLLRESGYRCQSAITRQWIDAFENYVHSDFLWLPPEHTA